MTWGLKFLTRFGPNRVAADMEEMENLLFWWFMMIFAEFFRISEANMASKQPRRSDLTSDLKSVTSITYIYMCILLIWQGAFWWPRRPLRPPNSLWGQIWPQIWNQWPQLPTYPCAYCLYVLSPFWGPFGGLRGHYSLGGQIWSQIWNLWFKFHMIPYLFGQFRPVLALFLNFDRKKERRKKMNWPLLDLSASPQVIRYHLEIWYYWTGNIS